MSLPNSFENIPYDMLVVCLWIFQNCINIYIFVPSFSFLRCAKKNNAESLLRLLLPCVQGYISCQILENIFIMDLFLFKKMLIWPTLQVTILLAATSKDIEKLINLIVKKSEVTVKWFTEWL